MIDLNALKWFDLYAQLTMISQGVIGDKEIRSAVEQMDNFDGWDNFNITWGLAVENNEDKIKLKKPVRLKSIYRGKI